MVPGTLSLLLACHLGAGDPVAAGDAPDGDSVRYDVRSTSDLKSPLGAAFRSAREGGATVFEVVLAPGVYEGRKVSLKDPEAVLVVRSAGPEPAILRKSRLSLQAAEVELRGLVIEGWSGDEAAVDVQVSRELRVIGTTVRQVAFRGEDGEHAAPVTVALSKPAAASRVHIEDSWFVDNRWDTGGALLRVAARPGGQGTLSLSGVGLLRNGVQTLIDARGLAAVQLAGVAAAEPVVDHLLWVPDADTAITVADSAIALGGGGPWLRRTANPDHGDAPLTQPTEERSVVQTGRAVEVPGEPDLAALAEAVRAP